jgi:hypothetical protein
MKREYKIFRWKINKEDLNKIKDLNSLKKYLIDNKIVHSKYKYKIQDMTLEDLKNFVYTGYYENFDFEGVAPVLTAITHKDVAGVFTIIKKSRLNPMSFIRLIIFALQHYDLYEDNKLGYYIKFFKLKYETKFKKLLIDYIGKKRYITKLDLLIFFNKLLRS